jgi:hypothetical protein
MFLKIKDSESPINEEDGITLPTSANNGNTHASLSVMNQTSQLYNSNTNNSNNLNSSLAFPNNLNNTNQNITQGLQH